MLFNGRHGRARLLGFVAIALTQGWLTSCASTDSRSLNESASTIGKLAAHRTIPPLPNDCRIQEQHVVIAPDADPWALLGQEGDRLNRANSRVGRCAGFFDQVKYSQERATK